MTIASAIRLDNHEVVMLDIENNPAGGGTNYKGLWDASTNTPFLSNGVGAEGDYYEVSVGGTVDFGQGDILFIVGDTVVYQNGIWGKGKESVINDDEISTTTTWSSSKILQVIETASTADVYTYKGETSVLPDGTQETPNNKGDVWLLTTDGLPYWWDGDVWRRFGVDAYTKAETDTLLDGKVDKETGKGLSKNDFTDVLKNKLDGIEVGAEVNTIESVSVNNSPLTPDANKNVNVTVPTKTSDITNDSGFITTSDLATVAETGSYTDLSDKPTLGTASAKNYTDNVRPGNHGLVESNAVYNAIINAVSSIYTPRGSLSCAELTSALLIEANVGNVYEMSDSGTTSALFLQGAGVTINTGDNVGIIKSGENDIMFNLMANAFDLTDYQKKDLSSPITVGGVSQTTVEGTLGALANMIGSEGYVAIPSGVVDCNALTGKSGARTVYINNNELTTNIPNAFYGFVIVDRQGSRYNQELIKTTANGVEIYHRNTINGTNWNAWEQVTFNSTVNDLQLTYNGTTYPTTSDLITQLTSDIVARKHSSGTVGGNIAITWTGKSCITGSYSIHDSGAGFVVLDFENDQDGKNHCVYYISSGSATGITWSKLANTSNFYNLSSYGGYATGTKLWWKIPNLFVAGSDFTYRTNVFLLSARESNGTALLIVGDNGSNTRSAKIVNLSGNLDGVTDFYFDDSTCTLYYSIQWSRLQIVQLSGQKINIVDAIQSSSSEASQYTAITPIKIQAESDTGWITFNSYLTYRKKNGIVYVSVNTGSITTNANAGFDYGTLPEGFRPSNQLCTGMSGYGASVTNVTYGSCQQWLRITTSGNVNMVAGLANTTYSETHGFISYPV